MAKTPVWSCRSGEETSGWQKHWWSWKTSHHVHFHAFKASRSVMPAAWLTLTPKVATSSSSLCNWQKQHTGNGKNKMTTERSTHGHTTRVQTLWKMNLFSFHFYTKCRGCLRQPGLLLLLQGWFFFFLFQICIYSACKPCLRCCLHNSYVILEDAGNSRDRTDAH